MENQELHPIPEGSVVTEEMVTLWSAMHGVERDATIGTLVTFEKGQGQMPAQVFDYGEVVDVFAPLRTAYFKALGVDEPPHSIAPPAEEAPESGEAEAPETTE